MKRIGKNEGFTLIELLIVVAIIGIIAAIAIPGLLRARQSGNEASAIGSVRALSSAQATFASSCGGGGYASTLPALGTAPPGAGAVPFISPDLVGANAAPGKSGYLVDVIVPAAATPVLAAAATCNAVAASNTDFAATAIPMAASTGSRAFSTDARGTLYQDNRGFGAAFPDPLVVNANVSILGQ